MSADYKDFPRILRTKPKINESSYNLVLQDFKNLFIPIRFLNINLSKLYTRLSCNVSKAPGYAPDISNQALRPWLIKSAWLFTKKQLNARKLLCNSKCHASLSCTDK